MQFAIEALSLTVLTIGGGGQQADTISTENGAAPLNDVNMVEQVPVAEKPGQVFASFATKSDAVEIGSSNLALANSQSASVKTLVVSMIKADTESAMKLAAAASETSLAIVPTPSSMAVRQKTLLMLKEKKGAGFDAA